MVDAGDRGRNVDPAPPTREQFLEYGVAIAWDTEHRVATAYPAPDGRRVGR